MDKKPSPREIFTAALRSDDDASLAKAIEDGVDIHAPIFPSDMCALHAAASQNCPRVLLALLLNGAGIEQRDHWGRTPLLAAADAPDMPAFATLLAWGADPLACERDGRGCERALAAARSRKGPSSAKDIGAMRELWLAAVEKRALAQQCEPAAAAARTPRI